MSTQFYTIPEGVPRTTSNPHPTPNKLHMISLLHHSLLLPFNHFEVKLILVQTGSVFGCLSASEAVRGG